MILKIVKTLIFSDPTIATTLITHTFLIYLLVALWVTHFKRKLDIKAVAFVSLIPLGALLCYPLLFARWLIKLKIFAPMALHHLVRLHRGSYVMQYFAMFGLINTLLPKPLQIHHKIKKIVLVSGAGFITFFFITTFMGSCFIPKPIFALPAIYNTMVMTLLIYQFLQTKLSGMCPKILQKQLDIILPLWIIQYFFWDALCDGITILRHIDYSFYSVGFPPILLCLSNVASFTLFSLGLHRLINLRFLNIKKSVDLYTKIDLSTICAITERLTNATSTESIKAITYTFFRRILNISPQSVNIQILGDDEHLSPLAQTISCTQSPKRILIKDEIEYNSLHEKGWKKQESNSVLKMMLDSHASIFIPIIHKNVVIASINISKIALQNRLLTKTEQGELEIFATAIAAAVTAIKCEHINKLLEKKEEENEYLAVRNETVKKELHKAHFFNKLYKESIEKFIRTAHIRKIGIVEYRNRKFIHNNKEGVQLLGFDISQKKNLKNPIAKTMLKLANDVITYKTIQYKVLPHEHEHDHDNEQRHIAITAMPITDTSSVIILLHRPDVADVLRKQIKSLSKPINWDYSIYLETTKLGHSINLFLPGTSSLIMQTKINLLKAMLSLKTILIKGEGDDLPATVDLIYRLHLKKDIYTLDLDTPEDKTFPYAIKLFGINELFLANTDESNQHPALLKQLDSYGVVYIKDIENLSLETQKQLAEYLATNLYTPFRGGKKKSSNVPIVCSTKENHIDLLSRQLFSQELYEQLYVFELPDLIEFPKKDLMDLAESITRQMCLDKKIAMFLSLSSEDKMNIHLAGYTSINELRKHIKTVLLEKAERYAMKNYVKETVEESETFNLAYIRKLGKNALQNRRAMEFLWIRFNKQPSKIASFLKVHRTSIYRRCQAYELQ